MYVPDGVCPEITARSAPLLDSPTPAVLAPKKPVPITVSSLSGLVVLIPTRLLELSTCSVLVSTVRSPLILTSVLAFISTVGAVISTSVSASMSSCPSAEELIFNAVSLNCTSSVVVSCILVPLVVLPFPNTSVSVSLAPT